MTTKTPAQADEAPKRPLGRPPVSPENRVAVRAIRLTDDHWAKFQALGGVAWLRERIKRAKLP